LPMVQTGRHKSSNYLTEATSFKQAGSMASVAPPAGETEEPIQAIRHFNRFYTGQIGVLQKGLLESPYSLTEVRLLYELAHRGGVTATELSHELALDAGYLSRMLKKFDKRGWISRQPVSADRRQTLLALSAKGSATLRPLEERSNQQVQQMLARISGDARQQLVHAMRHIEQILAPASATREPYLLRTHQPGDVGWIVYRHGVLYAEEYHYDERFEAKVAEIVARFIHDFDARRDRCWIAEKGGERVGSVLLVHQSTTVARLRVLLVEPSARGLGIGRRLVQECVRFARQVGYKKIVLWTQSELKGARKIYEQANFQLIKKEPHRSWGREDLVAETWELKL
jgi:DNA-binding MarR family transcriptional regulator/N-acetylglutamate synthase-like GNAT family acetyltransferase